MASFEHVLAESGDWLEDYPELRGSVDASRRALEQE
jgi:hypothetical protein